MKEPPVLIIRHAIGRWLYRRRRWAVVPLLATGLLLDWRAMSVPAGTFMMIAGATGVFFGTLLRIVCFTFHDPRSLEPRAAPPLMITGGPYAVTRNPLYLGEAAFALGIAMMSRMPWLVLVTLAAVMVAAALIIEWEEHRIRLAHGDAYTEYCETVPRWFSFGRLWDPDSYRQTRGSVRLLAAIRAESGTMLVALLSILAFLAKADLEILLTRHV